MPKQRGGHVLREPGFVKAVGARIAAARKRKGLSRRALGREAEMSVANLAGIESGDAQPRLGTVAALAKLLGVSVRELLPGEPVPAPPPKATQGAKIIAQIATRLRGHEADLDLLRRIDRVVREIEAVASDRSSTRSRSR